ncbi:MAG: carbamoyltransferase HypF [Candidatus Brocadiia bacterium]
MRGQRPVPVLSGGGAGLKRVTQRTESLTGAGLKRCRITVRGRVQGVGFRPTVYRALTERGCAGSVRNTPEGAVIEAEAPAEVLRGIVDDLPDIVPPRARLDEVQVEEAEPQGQTEFRIVRSAGAGRSLLPIPPDLATCAECAAELHEAGNRRRGYPFNTCTACGPRFTIAREVPFDRPTNAMDGFPPCAACAAEYANPADRRFHAQTLSCPECGPSLSFLTPEGQELNKPLVRAGQMLADGRILAIKGLGGFHLACDATRQDVVEELRRRKQRPAKPFAVMARDIETARRICRVGEAEADLLCSAPSPIVLLEERADCAVADAVAPGLADLGVMLPYTPLHVLLMERESVPAVLVMTSCNRSEEPIAITAEHVLEDLGDLVDGVLTHNRPILNRCDDSVVAVLRGRPLPMRRSRGYVPEPIVLERGGPPVLATGGMMKNTFALTSGRRVFLSQHIGDVSDADNAAHFARTFRDFSRLLRLEPEVVVCDLHPDYPTTHFARDLAAERDLRLMQMQQHHAHVVSCLAENGRDGPAIGVSWDGTGYGDDGAVWGGEFMVADRRTYTRRHHLAYVPMPGGEAAIWHPTRMALAHLARALGPGEAVARMAPRMGESRARQVLAVMERDRFSPPTSSAGRLFDAVAALLGLRTKATYEGQPARELEAMAAPGVEGHYRFDYDGESIVLDALWEGICADLDARVAPEEIAARFHNTMARLIVETCRRLCEETGIALVALSGGVMQNRALAAATAEALEREGFEVLLHTRVPPNDGGLCLGQAAWALGRLGT